MRRLLPFILLALALTVPAAGAAAARLGANPADALVDLPIEEPRYDRATHCTKKTRPGVVALQRWLEANVRGVFWGSYRCEKWGPKQASLHAENRAIDWRLDAAQPADARASRQLIDLLLATDKIGNPQALARRMGVEELIWDCAYWGTGMAAPAPYRACFTKNGKPRKRVDRTTAHRDHIHIGMTKPGAAGKTSFWQRHTG